MAPTLSSVLETVVPPQSAAARDAVQNVIDHGWPSPAAAQPVEAWRAAGRNVIEGLRLVADRGAFDLRVDDARLRSSRNTLTRLRLAVALTLVDGEQAIAVHERDRAARDVQTATRVGEALVSGDCAPLRIVGLSTLTRALALARRAGISAPPVTLPAATAVIATERSRFLAAVERATAVDATLAAPMRAAATALALEYYDALAREATLARLDALVGPFDTLYTRVAIRYTDFDPRIALQQIPPPPPTNAQLGRDMATLVFCSIWLDSRQLLRALIDTGRAMR